MVYLPKFWLISTVNVGYNIPYIEYLGIPMPIPTDCFKYPSTIVDEGIGNMGPKARGIVCLTSQPDIVHRIIIMRTKGKQTIGFAAKFNHFWVNDTNFYNKVSPYDRHKWSYNML